MRTYNLKKRHNVDGSSFDAKASGIINFFCEERPSAAPEGFGDTEEYLKSLQNEDGSFKWSLVQGQEYVSLENAFYAVLSLKAMGCKDAGVFEKAREYILDQHNADGSFGSEHRSLKDTSCALLSLRAMDYGERELFDKSCEFLKDLQNPDGGFGLAKRDTSDMESTAFALLALKAAGTPDSDMPNSRRYLMRMKWDDGGFGRKSGPVPGSSATDTSYAILALCAMGEPAVAIPGETRNYLKEKSPEKCMQMLDIYSTVISLFAAGEPVSAGYAEFAKKLKVRDGEGGGFRWSSIDEKANVMNTFYAVMTVKAAGKK